MRLSVVVPVFNQDNDVVSFVDKLNAKLREHTDDFHIIISTAEEFEFVERLHERLQESVDIVALKTTDDYQQIVMAGVDKSDGDATIIITPDYDVNLIDNMVKDWLNGKKVVCFRRKHSKFGSFITKLRLKIYNIFLFLFGDIFSIGILKDAQLLDKEIVDKMKSEQDMAHRFRTMYAPLDYNTAVHDIEHPIERFETKGSPQFDFWLGCVGAILTLVAFVTCIILAIGLNAPIWVWTLFIVFALLFEFLFIALLVNATARVKIGILHNMDAEGRIYNLAQEYYQEETTESVQWFNPVTSEHSTEKSASQSLKLKQNTPKKVVKSTSKVKSSDDEQALNSANAMINSQEENADENEENKTVKTTLNKGNKSKGAESKGKVESKRKTASKGKAVNKSAKKSESKAENKDVAEGVDTTAKDQDITTESSAKTNRKSNKVSKNKSTNKVVSTNKISANKEKLENNAISENVVDNSVENVDNQSEPENLSVDNIEKKTTKKNKASNKNNEKIAEINNKTTKNDKKTAKNDKKTAKTSSKSVKMDSESGKENEGQVSENSANVENYDEKTDTVQSVNTKQVEKKTTASKAGKKSTSSKAETKSKNSTSSKSGASSSKTSKVKKTAKADEEVSTSKSATKKTKKSENAEEETENVGAEKAEKKTTKKATAKTTAKKTTATKTSVKKTSAVE